MKRIYNIKKTLSMKQFIAELGDGFSEYMKKRLLELGARCVLTRKENINTLDLKHVEHTRHECACTLDGEGKTAQKEYSYGQFIVIDEGLYFSERCIESEDVTQAPDVSSIYKGIKSEVIISNEGRNAKKVDDSSIDYVIDSILNICPPVSQAHLDIVQGMISRQENK